MEKHWQKPRGKWWNAFKKSEMNPLTWYHRKSTIGLCHQVILTILLDFEFVESMNCIISVLGVNDGIRYKIWHVLPKYLLSTWKHEKKRKKERRKRGGREERNLRKKKERRKNGRGKKEGILSTNLIIIFWPPWNIDILLDHVWKLKFVLTCCRL